MDELTALRSRR